MKKREISIHAPREGSDGNRRQSSPTLKISIHAPREGSDYGHSTGQNTYRYFYPRSPRGERLYQFSF